MKPGFGRRGFLVGLASLPLAACDRVTESDWGKRILGSVDELNRRLQRLLAPRARLAREYAEADISPVFKPNGNTDPNTEAYHALAAGQFAGYRLEIAGLVEHPQSFSLAELKAMPARTQITRHDCVEGWSCIGEWSGPQLALILAAARPKPNARYAVFYCADPMTAEGDPGHKYYESLALSEAAHPQTILAHRLNGAPLDVAHGAPVRLRAERQLGYKQPKYLERVVLTDSLAGIGGGKGGYWEDLGYTWYGGI